MPKIVDREQYRKQLLTESFELFAEIGYGKITMRQLAQKLGISTGTLSGVAEYKYDESSFRSN